MAEENGVDADHARFGCRVIDLVLAATDTQVVLTVVVGSFLAAIAGSVVEEGLGRRADLACPRNRVIDGSRGTCRTALSVWVPEFRQSALDAGGWIRS